MHTCEEIHDLHGVSRSRSKSKSKSKSESESEPRSKSESESKSKVESRCRSRSRLRGDSPSISQVCHLDWVTVRELRRACRLRHRETLYRHAIWTVRNWVVSPLSYKADERPCYETSAQNLDRPVSTRYTYQPFRKIDSSLRERPPSVGVRPLRHRSFSRDRMSWQPRSDAGSRDPSGIKGFFNRHFTEPPLVLCCRCAGFGDVDVDVDVVGHVVGGVVVRPDVAVSR